MIEPLARSLVAGTASTAPAFGNVHKIALAGDSHHGLGTALGTTTGIAEVRSALLAYGGDFLEIVAPGTWDRKTHAIGGSTVNLFIDGHASAATGGVSVSQYARLLTQIAADQIDTVLISLGYNDFREVGFDFETSMERLEFEIVAEFVAAGANVILVTVPPLNDFYTPPSGTDSGNMAKWNAALHARFGNMANVRVLDMTNLFGRPEAPTLIADRWYTDGVHLGPIGQFHAGRAYAAYLAPLAGQTIAEPATTWVSANPYFLVGETAQPQIWPWLVDTNTVTFAARTGGETGERILIPTFTNTYQQCGQATEDESTVRWSVTAAALAAGVCVVGNIIPFDAIENIDIRHHVSGNYHCINVWVPATAGTLDATAAEVMAAINADPVAAALVTAAPPAAYTGTGTARYGAMNCGHFNTAPRILSQHFSVADGATPADGAMIRATVEIEPIPGEAFNLGLCGLSLYRGQTIINYDFLSDVIGERPIPLPLAGHRIRLTTPWVEKESGWEKFGAWLTYSGTGRFRVYRLGVQQLTAS
jgi:hypothetical protein